jgi:hypothetical protein
MTLHPTERNVQKWAVLADFDSDRTCPADGRISRSELVAIFLAGAALRLLLAIAAMQHYHLTLARLAYFSDGGSYTAYARAIAREPGPFSPFDGRVFPGYPVVIAGVHLLGIPLPAAALVISWVCSGLAAMLSAVLCRDRRVGWGMVFLIPHYLLYSTLAMNEALLLAVSVAGLVAATRGRSAVAGGLLLGFAGLVRPNACFAVAGFLFYAAGQKRWRDAGIVAFLSATVVLAGMLVLKHFAGDALQNLHQYSSAYDGQLLTWPFRSLIMTPIREHVAISKTIYIWLHVLVIVPATIWAGFRFFRSQATSMDRLFAPWLVGNTAFVLCTGNRWGFDAFHRFSCWALPALLWTLRPILPKHWFWSLIAVISFALAFYGIAHNATG